jgi:hypothetical protein
VLVLEQELEPVPELEPALVQEPALERVLHSR